MVRNFGERRKKNKRGQVKKSKPRKPKTSQETEKPYEGIPQEEVTCREVAIYVPRPDHQVQENEPAEVVQRSKKNNNSYRSKREQRQRPRRERGRRVYYDKDEYDNDDDYYNGHDFHDYSDLVFRFRVMHFFQFMEMMHRIRVMNFLLNDGGIRYENGRRH